ncbi:MAG: fatty acid desaturase family protein [Planctomycetes bacterium]|nr:fatty acid desaturase family protein [Planctomycetota bacterium]
MAAGYSYSPVHRAVEVASIVLFATFVALLGLECVRALAGPYRAEAVWLIPTALIVGYLVADFVSGAVHWLADNFGHEKLPIIGPALIRPFREHHVDPREITRHDFIETNGNNCLVCWPWLVTYYFVLPPGGSLAALTFISTWLVFNVGILGTNQFHKWAHLEHPPAWIAKLQEWRLILSPDHHDIHHTPPFDRYYCITTGWLNPLLCDRLRFFQRAEALIRWALRAPKPSASPVESEAA